MNQRPSPNFDNRPLGMQTDILVVHYTGMKTGGAALDRLTDAESKVSAHYFIEEDGTIWQLVEEAKRAWHAGVSSWRGNTDINGRSIGIELVNPGHEFGYRPFPDIQMASLIELAQSILERHPIPARNVVGHADVAPTRKTDPGELFDWRAMAASGIGLWPEDGTLHPTSGDISHLREIGYDTTDQTAAICAFQRHFRPSLIDGALDGETARLIGAVHHIATASEQRT